MRAAVLRVSILGLWVLLLVAAESGLPVPKPLAAERTRREAPASGPKQWFTIHIAGRLLTAQVSGASLEQVLRAIGQEGGIKIVLQAPAEESVVVNLRGIPLDEGLRRILGARNFAFIYSDTASSRLTEVRIYPAQGINPGHSIAASHHGLVEELPPLALLYDEDPWVRREAVIDLQDTDGVKAIPTLAHILRDDPAASVRSAAARALGRTKSEVAIPALAAALLQDPRKQVREIAARALGSIAGVDAVPALIDALHDGSSSVRAKAVKALGAIGDLRAESALVAVSMNDESDRVRDIAEESLPRLGLPRSR